MPDFTALLHQNMADIKEPEAWPAGLYPGRVLSFAPGESSQKKTPYIKFNVGVTGYPDNFDDEDKAKFKIEGKTFNCDYYITEGSLFQLRDLLAGMKLSGFIDEALPQTIGEEVMIDVTQQMSNEPQRPNAIFNRVNRLVAGA